ncbi:MAG TPA: LuxR C-terminal-related transcriptional regulator, partial [Microlunatus sp.]
APHLASVLLATETPFVLLLDDVHELRSPACQDALSVVISGIPSGSQLVMASRWEPPVLSQLRASGDTVEALAEDLALDADGARKVFAEAQVTISLEAAEEISTQTEGWAVGLYLAAMSTRQSHSTEVSISGEDRFVADYLYRESLAGMPEATQQFLRRTSVLGQLCAPLCESLTGVSDGQQVLRELEDSTVFLIPIDRRRQWYRYHPLYREFLLGELRRVDPGSIMELRLRAADWYEANGLPTMAFEHLLMTSERDRCVQLAMQLILPMYNAGQILTVERWLAELGDPAIEAHPPLAVLAGWIAALSGHSVQAQRWATVVDAADAASCELTPVDGTASFESARAMLRAFLCATGPEQMLIDAEAALDEERPWSAWRATALCLAAEACRISGDDERAQALFAETSDQGSAVGNSDAVVDSEAELGLMAMDDERWDDAAAHVGRALAIIADHRMHDYAVSMLAFAVSARLAMHRGDTEEADRELIRAMRVRPECTVAIPYLAVRARLQLAKMQWARGRPAFARELMREIDDVLLHRPALGNLVGQVSAFRGAMTYSAQVAVIGRSPLSPAELRLLPYLQTHLTLPEIGQRLFVSRNTVGTQVAAIYRKLGVSSRSAAVDQATKIGLLGH